MALCDASTAGWEYMLDFEFIKGITCTYGDPAGVTTAGLLVMAGIMGALYIRTGDLLIPLGILLLTGGGAMALVAPVATPIAVLLLIVLPASVMAYAYYRFA
jgi:hypothetical protein